MDKAIKSSKKAKVCHNFFYKRLEDSFFIKCYKEGGSFDKLKFVNDCELKYLNYKRDGLEIELELIEKIIKTLSGKRVSKYDKKGIEFFLNKYDKITLSLLEELRDYSITVKNIEYAINRLKVQLDLMTKFYDKNQVINKLKDNRSIWVGRFDGYQGEIHFLIRVLGDDFLGSFDFLITSDTYLKLFNEGFFSSVGKNPSLNDLIFVDDLNKNIEIPLNKYRIKGRLNEEFQKYLSNTIL